MNTQFLNHVARLCRLDDEQREKLGSLSQEELVKQYILPYAVQVGGQNTRGWRIGSDFMKFMSVWGQKCVYLHRPTGELLMELAMQRISRGALLHEPYNLIDSLPDEYKIYTTAYDQYGLMDEACMQFLYENLRYCIVYLENETWQHHAEFILWGLLEHLDYDGEKSIPLEPGDKDYSKGKGMHNLQMKRIPWGSTNLLWDDKLVEKSPREIYIWAQDLAGDLFPIYTIVEKLAPIWRRKKIYFKKVEDVIDWQSSQKYFDIDKECDPNGRPYYGKWTTYFLKLTGQYNNCVINKIREEILAYKP